LGAKSDITSEDENRGSADNLWLRMGLIEGSGRLGTPQHECKHQAGAAEL